MKVREYLRPLIVKEDLKKTVFYLSLHYCEEEKKIDLLHLSHSLAGHLLYLVPHQFLIGYHQSLSCIWLFVLLYSLLNCLDDGPLPGRWSTAWTRASCLDEGILVFGLVDYDTEYDIYCINDLYNMYISTLVLFTS